MIINNPRTGIRMHCNDTGGSGVPVVLVHGLSGNYTRWAPVEAILSGKRRVIDYDLRGHGLTDKGPDLDCGFDSHVEDLAGLMDVLGVEKAVIAGHSMGGMIAQHFALKYPWRSSRLVLVATAACLFPDRLKRFLISIFTRILLLFPVILMSAVDRKTEGKPRELFPEKDNPALRPGPVALVKCLRAITGMDTREKVAGLTVPSLVLSSTRDELVAPALVKDLAGRIPDARFAEVENLSHYVPIEQPEKTAALIDDFLSD